MKDLTITYNFKLKLGLLIQNLNIDDNNQYNICFIHEYANQPIIVITIQIL